MLKVFRSRKMAGAVGKPTKMAGISKVKIGAISEAGKSQAENDICERVSREVRELFGVYFESLPANEVRKLESSSLFRSLLKKSSDKFFDLFSEKRARIDRYAAMQVRWYDFVRQMLGSRDLDEIITEILSKLDDLKSVFSCYMESVFIVGCKFVRQRQEVSAGRANVVTGIRFVAEDDVSLLKLGSVAVLKQKRRLRQIVHSLSKAKQGLRRMLITEIDALENMEDHEKKSIPSFIRSLDTGNLLVVKTEIIPFLRTFTNVFSKVVNQSGYHSLGRKLFKVAEQHVMGHTGLKRIFSNTLLSLNIQISPSIKDDLYNRLLRKVYNIRCNEFLKSLKCLEEHSQQKTQDRQVMLRNSLKVSK